MNVSIPISSAQHDYNVDIFESIEKIITELSESENHWYVIDSNVARIYQSQFKNILNSEKCFVINANEENKSLKGLEQVANFLQKTGANKKSKIVAIGGGITEDISALTAAIWFRGIEWLFVPTTLLAMCDSCIGAKCGVNFGSYKNQLGVFNSPNRVLLCSDFLETLTDDDLRSGFGEIIKLSLTDNSKFYRDFKTDIIKNGFRKSDVKKHIVESLKIKKQIIEIDEYEKDLRRILNYGHTFGHALESITHHEVRHGLAVAWGLDLVNFIAKEKGLLSEEEYQDVHHFVKEYFSSKIDAKYSAEDLINGIKRDKKAEGLNVNLILLKKIGKLEIVSVSVDDNLKKIIQEYLDKDNIFN